MSDSDSDESDIGAMIAKVEERHTKTSPSKATPTNNDIDEDDCVLLPTHKRGRKESISDHLARMEQNRLIQARKRQKLSALEDKDGSDSDDDDEDQENDPDAIEIVFETGAKSPPKKASALQLEESSDEEDVVEANNLQAVTEEERRALEQVRKARESLMQANRVSAAQIQQMIPAQMPIRMDPTMMTGHVLQQLLASQLSTQQLQPRMHRDQMLLLAMQGMMPYTVTVCIHAVLERNFDAHKESTTANLELAMNEPFATLQPRLLEHLKLPANSVVAWRCQGSPLNNLRTTPLECMLTPQQIVGLDATIMVSSTMGATSTTPKVDYGPKLHFTLRLVGGSPDKDSWTLTHGQREPLANLVASFRKASGMTEGNVALDFDGMNLLPSETPQAYDMEDEDLIEVKVG